MMPMKFECCEAPMTWPCCNIFGHLNVTISWILHLRLAAFVEFNPHMVLLKLVLHVGVLTVEVEDDLPVDRRFVA